jgi:class 3 adenylate cyclase
VRCQDCGEVNPEGNKFCSQCGSRLPPQVGSAPSRKRTAERRQLTMLFCDLVNSTPLSRRLDPEKARDIIRIYRDRCAHIIGGYEGTISGYAGDGISAYFGYPDAH